MKSLKNILSFLIWAPLCLSQWTQIGLNNYNIIDIAINGSNIYSVSDSGNLYRSTDSGSSWSVIFDNNVKNVETSPSGNIFIIRSDSVYKSTDIGNTWVRLTVWEQMPHGYYYSPPYNISISPYGNIFFGFMLDLGWVGQMVFAISENEGSTWETPGWDVLGGLIFGFYGSTVITAGDWWSIGGGGYNEINISSDQGTTWYESGYFLVFYPRTLGIFSNGNILIGSEFDWTSGLYLSKDSCNSWTKINSLPIISGYTFSNRLLVGTIDLGIFLFSDEGDSLGLYNEGLTNLYINTITIDSYDNVYIGTAEGIWRRPLSEIVTSVEENHFDETPTDFLLSQNFPNPFNPGTKMKYSVPQTSQVQIKIFDVLGNEIETLVNEEKPAGTYELTWNAVSLPSGVYFYQLKAGSFMKTKKMILLR